MIVQASGVLVAPAKTATNPRGREKSSIRGAEHHRQRVTQCGPDEEQRRDLTTFGTPAASVTAVNRIFHHQLQA